MDSIWKASGNGQLLPSGTLLTFNPPPPDVPQGRFAVRILFENKDQSLFPIGAQGAAAIYAGGGAYAGPAPDRDPQLFMVELDLPAAFLTKEICPSRLGLGTKTSPTKRK